MPGGQPEAQALPSFEALLAVLCVCESGCSMRLESLGCARKLAFHIAFGSLNIVSEDVKSCPVALRLNCHCFSPFVESQGNACAVRARTAHRAVLVGRRATAIFIAFGAKASLDRGFVARLTSMRGFALRDA
jgi:hypothetical protein